MEKRRVCEGRVGWFWIAVAAKWWSLKATGRIVEARFFFIWRAGRGSARVLVLTGCFLPRAVDLGGQSFWLAFC